MRANASAGHSAITASASGKRSGVAKRERGSTTNARQPAAFATRQSATAKSMAPKTTSRGGVRGEEVGWESTDPRGRAGHIHEQRHITVLVQLAALDPDQLLGVGAG